MRLVRGLVVIGAVWAMSTGVVRAQAKAPAAAVGKWKVASAVVDGKPAAMNVRRHKITFTLFPKGGWAMTVLERRRVRAARGQFRHAGGGSYVLAVVTPAGPVDVARVSLAAGGRAAITWTAPKPPAKGEKAALRRAAAVAKFGAKLGGFAKGASSIRLDATRGK
jgi:hypothetical protein